MESGSFELKSAEGSARVRRRVRPLRPLEWITVAHVGVFFIAATWAFGGQADWVRTPLALWGTLGFFITLAAAQESLRRHARESRTLVWLLPLIAFNAVVLIACLNPGLRPITIDGDLGYLPEVARPGWPSAALPELAVRALWDFDAIWIACFNVAFVLQRRRAIRALLLLVAGNALVLSVFGTVQRLVGAKGLYFGRFPSKQPHFFSTFVYHNHWGAFILLVLGVCLGLVWYFGRRSQSRDFFHSPGFGGLVAVLLIAATIPLSSSRSTSILGLVFLGGAFLHWTVRLVRQRRQFRESIAPPLMAAGAALILASGGIFYLARHTIAVRFELTREQLDAMRAHGNVGARGILYHDTWRMGRAKPWFGWGMASYPSVFMLYNTQDSMDGLPVFYHDAHSDWLQSFAEHGVAGSSLLGLCAVLPLLSLRRRRFRRALTLYPLAGCALVLGYAWVEFPFGNFAVVLTWWLCFFCAIQYARLGEAESPPVSNAPAS